MQERAAYVNSRLRPFTTTIFAEMSALADATGSINLGQGFPDTDGPAEIAEAAIAAIRAGHNQYPPGLGIPVLRAAIAAHQEHYYGLSFDPGSEVLVTAGATEAIAASILGLCEAGDEVITFDPTYDSYAACISLADARCRAIVLEPPDWSFDRDRFRSMITERTRLVLLNTPHNPTGKVFTRDELEFVAECCREHDLLAVTDEVYEHLVFDGEHIALASLEGMAERTITISSAAKTYSFTGWKVGWVCAPAPLVAAVRSAKQFLTYVNAGPFQHAIAFALGEGDRFIGSVARELEVRRDLFCQGMRDIGFTVYEPAGTYFATTDISPLGESDAMAFCRALPERCGVVAIPSSVFYQHPESGPTLVRWAFCKRPELLKEALTRLGALAPRERSGQ